MRLTRPTLWGLPVRDAFALSRRMYRIPDARFVRNLDSLPRALDLGPFMDQPVRQLSLATHARRHHRGDPAANTRSVFTSTSLR